MGTRHCAPTKQRGHGHPVWGNDSPAVWTQGEPQHLPQLVKAWDHFMYSRAVAYLASLQLVNQAPRPTRMCLSCFPPPCSHGLRLTYLSGVPHG